MGLAGVLDDKETLVIRNLQNRTHLGRVTVKMNGKDGLHLLPPRFCHAALEQKLQSIRIHVIG